MATPNVQNIIRIPGRLCYNPTDLTLDYPHGGVALGVVRDMVFHFGAKTTLTTGEEWGGVVTRAWYSGEAPFLACVLREFDKDALTKIFPNTQIGSVTDDVIINYLPAGSGNRPGYDLANLEIKLLFSPFSTEHDPFIIVYAAVPTIDADAALMLSYDEEIGIPITFWAAVDSSGRTYRKGRARDLNALL